MVNSRTNAVLSFGIYMANMWSHDEAIKIYGQMLGDHIWNKWVSYCNTAGPSAASMKMIYELDSNNLEKLVNWACNNYIGRMNLTPGKYYIAMVKNNFEEGDSKAEKWIFKKAVYNAEDENTQHLTSNDCSMCLGEQINGKYFVSKTSGYITFDDCVVSISYASDAEIEFFKNELEKAKEDKL